MPRRLIALLAVAAAAVCAATPAPAADALALKVLGFSPDGRYFGFVQYGMQTEAGTNLAETFLIDTSTDRFVQGAPLRVTTEIPDNEFDEAKELKALLAKSAKRAAGHVSRYNISSTGKLLVRVDDARSEEYGSGSDAPGLGAEAVSAKHPALGALELKLDPKEFDWPKTAKLGSHREAGLCAKEVDWQKGAGFRLTVAHGGKAIVLNDDKTIPASRFCALGYGITDVHAFDRPDGKVTLVVMVAMHTRGFEGSDRTFLAVTRVLDR
jgi:predicted secreted protein